MKGFCKNIEETTLRNKDFRKVVYTGDYMQLVYMCLQPGESIGLEQHGVDQFFRFEKGKGVVKVDNQKYDVSDGFAVVVPAGAKHNVTNTSKTDELHLYTIYAPPNHTDKMQYKTKATATKNDKPYDGKPTE